MQTVHQQTLVSCLRAAIGQGSGITFIESRESQEYLSYSDLYGEACTLLGRLQQAGARPYDEVVFQLQDNRDFLLAFWASLLGGLIAVPLAVGTNDEHRRKVFLVRRTLNTPFLLVDTAKTVASLESYAAQNGETEAFLEMRNRLLILEDDGAVGEVNGVEVPEPVLYDPQPDDIALIQFSSGSTGLPKGVTVTHRSAVVNTTDMIVRLNVTDRDRYLSWMPLTHDFGIIGMHLTPLVAGINQFQIPTNLFIRNPMLWLHKADEHRATMVASPNFGYRHFLKFFRPEGAAEWDLSSIRLIQNGAEPISPSLCIEFLDTLAPYGLNRQAMLPGYGLAEATLAVSYSLFGEVVPTVTLDRNRLGLGDQTLPVDESDPNAVQFVDVGYPVDSMEVRIADGDGVPVEEGTVGLIEIRGVSVTRGYYNNPEATARTISAEGWLNTGDLGFMRRGRIVITGRAKDIIFVGGINYYPHDIERIATELEEIDVNKIVVCGTWNREKEREEVAAFIYFKRPAEEFLPLASKVRDHILRNVGISFDYVLPIAAIPKTTSGKVQRFALAEELRNGEFDETIAQLEELYAATQERQKGSARLSFFDRAVDRNREEIRRHLRAVAAEVVGTPITDDTLPFADYGFDSVRGVEYSKRLKNLFDLDLAVSLIFDYPNVQQLADHILSLLAIDRKEERRSLEASDDGKNREIAIVGIGCRFPGHVDSFNDLIDLLTDERETVGEAPKWRWDNEQPSWFGSFLHDVERFDNTLFGVTPNEAGSLDPQQRLLLETAWRAIEDAAIHPETLRQGRTGIFIGISANEYGRRWENDPENISQYSLTGTMTSAAAGRLSYALGLNGPSMAVDTACSSSLVALHLAVRSLRDGESDCVIAGGVNLMLDPVNFQALARIGALSPDGRCKTFGAGADGYGRGEGCGIVLLKRLSDAERDGNTIYGVIAGTAVNHDGRSNGLTAPNGVAQERVIRDALRDAAISPEDVGYVEAHGTGTSLGDPQEINALQNVYGKTERRGKLVVGSIKSNIGHLESASGIAALIKAIASLWERKIFKSLHADQLSPYISWDGVNLQVAQSAAEWSGDEGRAAGVSGFGLTGTNAHVVLREYVKEKKGEESRTEEPPFVLPLSAAHPDALVGMIGAYKSALTPYSGSLRDFCATAATRRSTLRYRTAVVGRTAEELVAALNVAAETPPAGTSRKGIAWMFTGQGSQYRRMGVRLYQTEPIFRDALNLCSSLFQPLLGISIRDVIYGSDAQAEEIEIDETIYAQPTIFAVEYALSQLWLSYGLHPDVVGGHSIGEFAAACIAGVFSLEDAVTLVAYRARYMQELEERGGMLAAFCSEGQVRTAINGDPVAVAAINGPESIVMSGGREALEKLAHRLRDRGISTRPLNVSHAFHSPLMEPAVERFREIASAISFRSSTMPFVSSMTGKVIPAGEILNADYWTDHILSTVRFADAVSDAVNHGTRTFLEIGSASTLCALGAGQTDPTECLWVPSIKRDHDARQTFFQAGATLFGAGVDLNWNAFYPEGTFSTASLPHYPFLRNRFWLEGGRDRSIASGRKEYSGVETLSGRVGETVEEMIGEVFGKVGEGFQQKNEYRQGRNGGNGANRQNGHSGDNGSTTTMNANKVTEPSSRREEIIHFLLNLIAQKTGHDASDVPVDRDLFEIGLDSLVLIAIRQALLREYDVELPHSVLYDNATVESVARFIADTIGSAPEVAFPTEETNAPYGNETDEREAIPAATLDVPPHRAGTDEGVQGIINRQLDLMAEQLRLLRDLPSASGQSNSLRADSSGTTSSSKNIPSESSSLHASPPSSSHTPSIQSRNAGRNGTASSGLNGSGNASGTNRGTEPGKGKPAFVPYRKIVTTDAEREEGNRGRFLEELIERYSTLTRTSKARTDAFRPVFANNRNIAGFRPKWKELIYQLQVDRAEGSRVTDVDGNEFIDLTMGFGVNLFGHNPEFIREAVEEQLRIGASVGPMSPLACDVSARLAELTGIERASYYNSGTEAIMVALRLARATTGRKKVVIFSGSYHGSFDGILALPGGDDLTSVPLAPGVMPGMVDDIVVLPYAAQESLDYIRDNVDTLAGVLVETVQSRRPDVQPQEFLTELRQITEKSGTALIFDEVITGFRIHPGGAQHHFGIKADLVTYGKVIGGGMPIGIVAGKARFMDAVDGGAWSFGDASVPTALNTFVAGTFCHHPLAMTATLATLNLIAERGEEICSELNRRTAAFAESLNAFFRRVNVPIKIVYFGSLFRFDLSGDWELLYFALLTKGVYIWEGRNCFFSTAHTDEEIEKVRRAVIESVIEMVGGGFGPDATLPDDPSSLYEDENDGDSSPLQSESPTYGGDPSKGGSSLTEPTPSAYGGDPSKGGSSLTEPTPSAYGGHPSKGGDSLEMSSVQRRIFALSQSPEGELAYHISSGVFLEGGIDAEKIEECFRRIVGRHEGLRTGFSVEDGEFFQNIYPSVDLSLEQFEVTEDGEEEITQLFRRFLRPFDLSSPSLFRIGLVPLKSGRHLLLVDFHHIVCDGFTISIIFSEFAALYGGASLPPVHTQYREVLSWEKEFEGSEEYGREEAFWKDILSVPTEALSLPVDRERGGTETFVGGSVRVEYPAEEIRRFARENGCSVYMVLLAAYSGFLHRIAGERDFRIGIVHAGRGDERFGSTVGMFANSLLFPCSVDPDGTFRGLAQETKKKTVAMFENFTFPFERLAQLDRRASADQRVSFSYERAFGRVLNVGDAVGTEYFPDRSTSISDFALDVVEEENLLRLRFDYSDDLFDRESVERLSRYFIRFLQGCVAEPETLVGDISLLTEEETGIVLGNRTEAPAVQTLPHAVALFEKWANQTPDAVALMREKDGMSYGELNRFANKIASQLLSDLNVATNDVVALLIERSPEFIAAIFGIMKSGGGFLAIDPTLPDARVEYMLRDADVKALLTTKKFLNRPALKGHHIIDVEKVRPEEQKVEGNPGVEIRLDSIAYMIYTSGSTGRPKGVMVSHRNLTNYAYWTEEIRINRNNVKVVSLHTTPSFDMIIGQIMPALLSGKSLFLHDPSLTVDQIMERVFSPDTPIDCAVLTPSHALLLEDFSLTNTNVKVASIGGEALGKHHTKILWGLNPELQIINDYGPTEATVTCIIHHVNEDGRVTVVGKPTPGASAYILDSRLRPCPVGVIGEICIGGDCVALGYRNKPELTKERFIPNPFLDGDRLYRTGDLGRLLSDGTIEFFGRKDRQVKLFGNRIELDEIEAALCAEPNVHSAAVKLVEADGRKLLAAYVVASEEIDLELLRRALADRLPYYMVPSVLVRLEKLPLTPNGKINFELLPDPEIKGSTENGRGEGNVFPQSQQERDVAAAWDSVLQTGQVGVRDNFYEMGGDSIKAIRIASRLRKGGYNLDAATIMRLSTVESIARHLLVESSAINQEPVEGTVPLTPVQQWFFERELPNPNHWNQEVVLRYPGRLNSDSLKIAFGALTAHHDALRMSFRIVRSEAGGAGIIESIEQRNRPIGEGETFSLTTVELEGEKSYEEKEHSLLDAALRAHTSINIEVGPLLSGALLTSSEESVLVIAGHHLVVDAVSWDVLVDDLIALYEASERGVSIALPAKSDSFRDYAEALRRYAESEELLAERAYWEGVEEEGRKSKELPTDVTPATNTEAETATETILLDAATTSLLQGDAHRPYNTTTRDLLTATLAGVLTDWTGSAHHTILLEGHGRESIEGKSVDRTVGWFTTIYPLVLNVEESVEGSLETRLSSTIINAKEALRRVPRNGFGYGLLRYLTPAEKRGALQFDLPTEVLFNYLGDLDFNSDSEQNSKQNTEQNSEPKGEAKKAFRVEIDPIGPTSQSDAPRDERIAVDAFLRNGQLHWTIFYNREEYRQETIANLCTALRDRLTDILNHCLNAAPILTPSDLHYSGFRSAEEIAGFLQANGIVGEEVETVRPLVPMQEGMLFHHLTDSSGTSGIAQLALSLRGEVQVDLMEKAFRHVVKSYDSLRTGFAWSGVAEPLSIVYRDATPQYRLLEGDALKEGESSEELKAALLKSDWAEGFDLSGKSQVRMTLLRQENDLHTLVWTTHHIILDGWCIGLIFNALLDAYDACRNGAEPQRISSPSYGRYLQWLETYDASAALSFWKNYLEGYNFEGYNGTASLPVKEEKKGAQNGNGNEHERGKDQRAWSLSLEEKTIDALQAVASSRRMTLNTLVRTAWSLVLSHYAGRNDVLYGAVVSGRPSAIEDVESIVGLFINTVPVRFNVNPTLSFAELAAQSGDDALRAEPYHYTALTDIYPLTPLKEGLFDHILVFENYPLDQEIARGLKSRDDFSIESVLFNGDESFDLVLTVMLEHEREILFTYNGERYAEDTIREAGEMLNRILRMATEEADATIAAMLSATAPVEAKAGKTKPEKKSLRSLKETRATKVALR